MRILLATLLLLVTPSLAWAHTGHGEVAGFLHGFEHPIAGLDHVLAMLAVGVFAYVLGGRALWLVPVSFIGMMLVGFTLGLAQFDLPWVELGIALSSIAIGGAAALNRPMPTAAAAGLVGAFAIFHGHAHGAEMPGSAEGVTYAMGFLLATALLHLAGIAASLSMAKLAGRHGKMAAQCAAGLFAIGGVGILAGWL
jgi:urease accessory protein